MMWQDTPYTIPLVAASALSIILGLHILLRYHWFGNKVGAVAIFANTGWILGYSLELASASLPVMIFWDKMQFIAIIVLPTVWLVFTIYYTGHERWLHRYTLAALFVVPFITSVLALTNEVHGLIWRSYSLITDGPFFILDETYGHFFWFYTAYASMLFLSGCVLLVQILVRSHRSYRLQSGALLFGAAAPVAAAGLVLSGLNPFPYLNLIPVALVVTNLTVALSIIYFWLGEIMPLARETIIDSIHDSVIILDPENRIVDANPSAQTFIGSEFIGKSIETVWPEWSNQVEPVICGDADEEIVLDHKQRIYDVEISPLSDWHDRPRGQAVVLRDITDRKRVEKAEKYRLLAENVRDVIWTSDLNLRFTYMSPSVKHLRGYTAEEVMTQSLDEVLTPSSLDVALKTLQEELTKVNQDQEGIARSLTLELEHTCKDGSTVWAEVKMTGLRDANGSITGILGVSRDITERKKAEDRIKASLEEKEVLLREIHHRVKNNIQIISSLLRLQSQYIKDKKYKEMLKESQNRIKSMALIHEKLYQSESLASINFKDYIETLVHTLFRAYRTSTDRIDLNLEVEDVSLDVDTAIPCGLIINELVSNALEHAFPGGREGEITIALHPVNGVIELVVSDNGVGLPEDFDFQTTETLGLHLVRLLAENQLEGEINVDQGRGISFRIRFKKVKQ